MKHKKTEEPKWSAADGLQKKDGHFVGAKTGHGFRVVNGRIFVSPGNLQPMQALCDENRAIKDLLSAVADDLTKRLQLVTAGQRRWWDQVYADIGTSKDEYEAELSFHDWGITTTKIQAKKEEAPNEPGMGSNRGRV